VQDPQQPGVARRVDGHFIRLAAAGLVGRIEDMLDDGRRIVVYGPSSTAADTQKIGLANLPPLP